MTTSATDHYGLSRYIIDRVLQKRGRLHVYDRFEPQATALVVIDMQNYYLSDIIELSSLVPIVNRLAAGFRARGGRVAWVQTAAGMDGDSRWPLYHEHFFTPEGARRHREGLTPGLPGHALHAELEVDAQRDLFASKSRFSAFLPGRSDLVPQLEAHGISNVVIAGVVTNFCCETSARDAMMLDYKVCMAFDAMGARYPEDHVLGLSSAFVNFSDVRSSDDILDTLLR